MTLINSPAVKSARRRSTSANPDPVGQPAGTWNLTFNDEFTASAVNVIDAPNGLVGFGGPTWKAWYADQLAANPHTNNPGTELEYYDIGGLSVGSGLLTLTATRDNIHSADGLPYTSGMITSNPSYNPLYGFAEARLTTTGLFGQWPAFWMIPASYTWPPEIDILEQYNQTNIYTVSNWGNGSTVFGYQVATNITAWHVYGLKWNSTSLVWYMDGAVVATESNAGSVPNEPMYLVLNLAVKNTDNTPYIMQIDYVRFWQ